MFFLRQLEIERERLLELKEKLETTETTTATTEGADADADSIDKRLLALPRPTVFEKDSRCGGLWQSKSMTPNSNADTNDVEGMYDGMWINAPKEIFEFEDYTFDEHFRKPMPSYITRQQVLGYIQGATNDALETYTNNGSILFDTTVSWIEFDKTTKQFSVESVPSTLMDENNEEEYHPDYITTREFDKVIFATGYNSVPNIPERELNLLSKQKEQKAYFDKPVLHSSQIKSLGEKIVGKNFLFIGSAYSAEDLALSFIKRGANHIYVTTRSDSGYPITETASWPMDKVTVLMRTEIKEVLENNKLRMGRMDLPSPTIERIAEKYYDKSHENIVLEDIDAVIFCTGYGANETILDKELYGYAEHDDIEYSTELKTNVDASHWPNIYDPTVFDPDNGRPLPSETDLNSCGVPVHDNNAMLRADPENFCYFDYSGTYNHHLITNPGFFRHFDVYDSPLLNLDIQATYILKVITGEIPTPNTMEEMNHRQSLKMAEWLRHSSSIRFQYDKVYADALVESAYETDADFCPYDVAFSYFNMLLEAKQAGHPAGTFLEEASADSEPSERGCWGMDNFRFVENSSGNNTSPVYAFSQRGLVLMIQIVHHSLAHFEIKEGSNQTFRDIHYDVYKSVYTGTQPVPFSKLWLEVDDILGDVDTNTPTTTTTTRKTHENSSSVMQDCDSAPESQSFPHSEL